ncbi:MAG: hypothetical protein MN733_09205, partial [Nitrososphaera sp.]|nr:hypothetical protein [Nitrososphaera sp.]
VIGVSLSSYLLGAFWSATYWYGVVIFSCVILMWHYKSFREACNLKSVGFLAVSTAIYALGYWSVNHFAPWFGTEGGPAFILMAVGCGTVLLSIAHALFFRISWRQVLIACPSIYLVWYLLGFLLGNWVMERIQPPAPLLIWPVAIWQAAYLICMFALPIRPRARQTGA